MMRVEAYMVLKVMSRRVQTFYVLYNKRREHYEITPVKLYTGHKR